MTDPWPHDIDQFGDRLSILIDRAELGDDTRELVSEALEELSVVVEEMQAQNSELIASRADLEMERERYRNLFETVPDGYVVTDLSGIMREVNATAAELFGRPRHNLVGKPLGSLVEPPDRRTFYAQLNRIRHDGPGSHLTINLLIHDHVTVPVNLRAAVSSPRPDGNTTIRWLVHDRRPEIAGRELRLSEERLRSLFETANVGILLIDTEDSIIFSNQHADRLLANRSATGDWLAMIHPDDRATVRAGFRAAREHGRSLSLRHRVVRSPTEIRWVDHGLSPYRTVWGGIEGSVSTLIDVTAEHVAASELEESRDFTDAILETVGALVVVLTPTGRIQRFNAACETTTGFAAHEVIGESIIDVLVPDAQRELARDIFHDLTVNGVPSTTENDWLTADGGLRTISWSNTTLAGPDGSIQAVIGTGIDVTETRRLEARLDQADRLESIGRLAAGIAHDFNNTLATIQLRLDRLDRRRGGADRTDIEAMTTTIDHTQHVIADLLSFSRQQHLHLERTDISCETERIASLLADLLGGNIVIQVELAREDCVAYIDRGRFEQALTNLALNARDAMPTGGTITLTTALDRVTESTVRVGLTPGRYVRLTVADTGIGIHPDDQPHVFDPYFSTKPTARGTGLGLATTYGTIAQTGGTITVESEPGTGTTFTLWLPERTPGEPAQVAAMRSSARPDGRRALIVEDDPDMRRTLVAELDQLGFETVQAEDGHRALDHILTTFDVVVTDVQLPGLDGAAVAAAYRHHHPGLDVLFISGAPISRLRDLLPLDANLLIKPFTIADLASALGAEPGDPD